jgi:SAM-dependent methyltransferase
MNLDTFIKKVRHRVLRIIRRKPDILVDNKKIKIKECYICGEQFESFYRYHINKDSKSILNHFQPLGSDAENFGCYYCNSNDRERHLFMFFDKLSFWDKFKNARILHFAPEIHLAKKITKLLPSEYVKCDLFPKEDWRKIDITKIDFDDNYFDILICNHVIEHVYDHLKAIKEISRVLKKNGIAILQTPYSELLYYNFEDPNINTDELRLLFYGQEDHVRVVSKRQFIEELSRYFKINIVKNDSLFNDDDCFKYGVNKKEDLVMVINNKGIL